MPVWRRFHRQCKECRRMKLWRSQLSFPGPFWLMDGRDEFHSIARRQWGLESQYALHPYETFPHFFFISTHLILVLVSSAGQYWSSATYSLPALPSMILQNMPAACPWGSTSNMTETVTAFSPSALYQMPVVKTTLWSLTHTKATDYSTHGHIWQSRSCQLYFNSVCTNNILLKVSSVWSSFYSGPLTFRKKYIPFK